MRLTLLLFLIGLFSTQLDAQIEEFAPSYNPYIKYHNYLQSQSQGSIFMKNETDTLDLPFLDDFSYQGPYPKAENWCNYSVFVNPTLSKEPPSIGVATFDGLSQSGSPYNMTGAGDTLTSSAFRLANYSEADEVYLSFFYQAKGWGDKPEVGDSLIVEFKLNDTTWVTVDGFDGLDASVTADSIPPFTFHNIAVPSSYLYDGFQFRFRNYSSGKGQVDLWHVDYVRLTSSFEPTENFNDVAFTEQAPSFLGTYSAMPWKQFEGFESEEMTDSYTLTLFNHFPVTQEIQNRIYMVDEGGNNFMNTNFYSDIALANITPGTHITNTQNVSAGDFNTFMTNMQGQSSADTYYFESTFSFTQTGQDPAFPASFENDVIKRTTIFDNYFAYDDGTADSNVKAQNPGTEIAVKFECC